ncbi:ABC-F family ATP-binding cassette domain-containing protein [Comamonas guangdongensis]|uniref:ABC-F family ATP-binding cassette domain-containing protein n=1 Tax=Comamonas guangdongensis TaxID=510515 RepID=A0ABV3ZXA3_9BURK
MTEPRLTLHSVSYMLPHGRQLFSHLSATFGAQRTAIVGRNGVGKSVLARILAGELMPSSGSVAREGRVHYLPQNPLAARPLQNIAALAGIEPALQALERIEQGGCDVQDFELLAERWDLRQQFCAQLERAGLPPLAPQTAAGRLSGGQAMRVALLGARLAQADFLILDEPSNHLDAAGRRALTEELRQWRGGLLLISHDRELLEHMDGIAELSSGGLSFYGGGYGCYQQAQRQQAQNALDELARLKLQRSRAEQALRSQQERQNRKQARGERHGKQANQAKLLLGFGKERAQASSGRLAAQHAASREALDQSVREAAQAIDWQAAAIHWHLPDMSALPGQGERMVAEFEQLRLPWPAAAAPVSLQLRAGQRLAICGPNGCGKSTLLQIIAGRLQPLHGRRRVHVPFALLDQDQNLLQPEQSLLGQLLAAAPRTPESLQRMRLAQLGLDARHVEQPCGGLSGGERLKAAMACALYRDEPAQLLLLDEPDNHLDLQSLQALESMLRHYPGTLVMVSHDAALLQAVGLTHRLEAGADGWRLQSCEPPPGRASPARP